MNDSTDSDTDMGTDSGAGPTHPLQRAHTFFLKAAPVIREVNDTLERHGGLDHVRDKVVKGADEFVRKVDDVVANATAIEGEVVERPRTTAAAPRTTPRATPVRPPAGSPVRWVAIGIVAAAATYGALRLQRRT